MSIVTRESYVCNVCKRDGGEIRIGLPSGWAEISVLPGVPMLSYEQVHPPTGHFCRACVMEIFAHIDFDSELGRHLRRYHRHMAPSVLDELFTIVNERAYAEGDFTLASGQHSRYYFDGKLVVFDQRGSRLFAQWVLGQISEMRPRPVALGGLEIGAIPIACTAVALAQFPLSAFVVRKQVKSHGTSKTVEGPIAAGDDVVVVDDVITTGESTLKAVRAVRELGARVRAVFCLVDRQENHSPEFQRLQTETIFRAAFPLSDFLRRRGTMA